MKFRKKPVVIEAFRWTGDVNALATWAAQVDFAHRKANGRPIKREPQLPIHVTAVGEGVLLEIDTLEGTHRADIGDWIIQGIAGEFYPCDPDIFEATYEAVS